MATALKLKRDINKLKAAIRSKATPQSYVPKLKAQLQKAEADYESVKAGKKSAPKASKQVKSTMDKLKAIIKKKKYGAYRAQGVDLKKDADRPALRSGKRISKNGNTYYEYRANRIDVKQPPKRYPKLEDGGEINKDTFSNIFLSNGFSERKSFAGVKFFVNKKQKHDNKIIYSSVDIDNRKVIIEDEDGKIYYDGFSVSEVIETLKQLGYKSSGGYMAGGGNTEDKQYAIEIKLEDGEEMAERRKRRNADTRTERVEVYSTPEEAKEAYIKYKNKGEYEGIKIKRIEYVGVYDEDNFRDGGYMAKKGKLLDNFSDKIQEGDIVWDSGNKRYGTVLNTYDFKYGEIRLDSDGNQPEENLHKLGSEGDKGTKDKLIEALVAHKRLIVEYPDRYDKVNYEGGGMTPADLQKQIWNLTARIAKLGDIESRAASDEIEMLMKQRKKLQSMALNHGDVVMAQGGELHRSQEEKFKYGGYMAKGGIYDSDNSWVVTFQNQDSGEFEKVSVRANNKKNAIAIAEEESGLNNDWTYYSAEKEMASGGYMAKGGATEHGLKKGDTIWADQFWDNTVIVDNPKTGRAVVNLETGKRKEQGKI